MKNKPGHIKKEDFQRYLNNQMNGQERNKFERKLEQNPFEYEAMEGFTSHDPSVIMEDLKDLQNKIQNKSKGGKPWLRIAAIALVLITSGIIYYQIDTNEVQKQMVENNVEEDEIPIPKEETAVTPEKPEPEKETIPTNQKEKRNTDVIEPPQKEKVREILEEKVMGIQIVEDELELEEAEALNEPEKLVLPEFTNKTLSGEAQDLETRRAEMAKDLLTLERTTKQSKSLGDFMPQKGLARHVSLTSKEDTNLYYNVSGRIVSAENKEPIPGATIYAKGTKWGTATDMDGKFTFQVPKDSNNTFVASFVGMEQTEFEDKLDENVIALEPSTEALDEVVVVGYGIQRKQNLTGSTSRINETNTKAIPLGGFKGYNAYLDENSLLDEPLKTKKTTVRVKLFIEENGSVSQIKPLNNPDSLLFENTKEIILEGPKWSPAIKDGIAVESETVIKIKFKSRKK